MIERFSVRIDTPAERNKALNRIFQAALLNSIAVVTSAPRGRAPSGELCTQSKSLIVADSYGDKDWLARMFTCEPERVVAVYQRGTLAHRALLNAIEEDIEEVASAIPGAR